jgi:hypothetical protein
MQYHPLFCWGALLAILPLGCRAKDTTPDSSLAAADGSASDIFQRTSELVFDDAVHEITMHVDGDTWNKMISLPPQGYSCVDSAPYGHVKEFYFKNLRTGQSVIIHNAGLRIKGNTSCDDPIEDRGYKIKLNAVDKVKADGTVVQKVYEKNGQRLNYPPELAAKIKKQNLFGMEELGLRRGGNDRSRIRDLIASDVFEFGGELARRNQVAGAPRLGGPVYRGSVAYVKIHNGYGTLTEGHMGLVELVDEGLIKTHYGKGSAGHLFKIQHAKGTFLKSDMPEQDHRRLLSYYEPKVIDGEEYEGDTEAQRARAAEIIHGLRHLIERATDARKFPTTEARRAELEKFLDIDNLLSYLVSVNLTGHFDSLVGPLSNNDYVFMNQQTKKWGVLTWDLDNTFGSGNRGELWMAGIRDFGVDLKHRPLFKAVMDHYPNEYKQRVRDYLSGVFGWRPFNERITRYRDLITGGANNEMYELIYNFYAHRFANAWCQVYRSENSLARIRDGRPVIQPDGMAVECDERR